MKATRIRSKAGAQRYVTRCVATILRNELDNGSGWLHRYLDGDDGNLADISSERLVHEAVRELIQQLANHGGKRG